MSTQSATTKAYEEKISAQLQQVKAQLGEFEARAKSKIAQVEIDSINHLNVAYQQIDKKREELKTAGEAKVEQVKAEIDADVAKLKASLAEFSTKFKTEPRTKAS